MTTKHTQGPWKATKCTMREGFIIGQNGVAVVGSVKRKLHGGAIQNIAHVGPDEANARLIAAAPDLLAALEMILPFAARSDLAAHNPDIINGSVITRDHALTVVRSAIAKAKGE